MSHHSVDSESIACRVSVNQQQKVSFINSYESYWEKLFQFAYRRLKDKEIAKELVQDIFLDLWERKDSLEIRNCEHYLFRAVKFALIDHLRAQVIHNNYLYYCAGMTEMPVTMQDNLTTRNILELMEEGMGELSAKARDVFRLSYLHNWKNDKIARHLHLSEKAVEYHLTKSQKALKRFLQSVVY